MKQKLRILVVFDSAGTPPADQDFSKEFEDENWFTEAAVVETLQLMGHNVRTLGIYDDISLLINNLKDHATDIVFNLTEVFMGKAHLDKNIPALLDLLDIPYTGCSADGLILCNNKALSKKILKFHRIRVPKFYTFKRGNRIWLPKKLQFPVIVKPLREEASTGISQASYVTDEAHFRERVEFLHNSMRMSAIVEEYIGGRELYVGVMGTRRLVALPIRDMKFDNVPDGEPTIATYKAKWDEDYRKKWGITNGFADDLPEAQIREIHKICKRAYRALNIDSHARFDCRLTEDGQLYIIEANGNPEIAQGDEFAESALRCGYSYDRLLKKLITMGIERHRQDSEL